MKPTEIAARGSEIREELRQLGREAEALAEDVARHGVPADWGLREKDEAHLLFYTIKNALPQNESCATLRETLRTAMQAVAAH